MHFIWWQCRVYSNQKFREGFCTWASRHSSSRGWPIYKRLNFLPCRLRTELLPLRVLWFINRSPGVGETRSRRRKNCLRCSQWLKILSWWLRYYSSLKGIRHRLCQLNRRWMPKTMELTRKSNGSRSSLIAANEYATAILTGKWNIINKSRDQLIWIIN